MKALICWFAIVLFFIIQVAIRWRAELVSDAAWFIYIASGLLDGKILYKDFIEVNPPLGIWLMVQIVWISRLISANAIQVLGITMVFLSAISLAFVNHYLRFNKNVDDKFRMTLVTAMAFAILFFPGRDFSEREHFAVLFFLPWMFLRLLRASGGKTANWEAIIVGIFASVAICLKPQSLCAPLAVEIIFYLRHRKLVHIFAVENISAVLFAVAYVLIIIWQTPLFLTEIIELGTKAYVPYNGESAIAVLMIGFRAALFLGIALVFRAKLKNGTDVIILADVLLAAGSGFLLSYFIQMKGFPYQAMPAEIICWLGCCATCFLYCQASNKIQVVAILPPILAIGLLFNHPQSYPNSDALYDKSIVTQAPNAKSIFIASTLIDYAFPYVVKHNLIWASRLPSQWLTPYVVAKTKSGSNAGDPIIQKAVEYAVTDLATLKPDIVFIDQPENQAVEPGGVFDYLGFWSSDPRFTDLWKNYEYRETANGMKVYVKREPKK